MKIQTLLAALLFPMASFALQVGAWVGGDGTYPQPTKENVEAFQKLQDHHVDLISLFVVWDSNDWDWTQTYANIALDNGSTLVVTWMPNGYSAQNIVDGTADAYIRTYADGVKSFGKEIWLRPLHEANGNWYDWSVGKSGSGNTNDNVAAAYRHIVDIFNEEGVTNVKWVWTTNSSNSGSGTSFVGTYPGDNYVDYISIDGYNWGTAQSWSSWHSFMQVFSSSYKALANIDKPLFIAEFSSSELGGDKAAWITDMFNAIPTTFPRIFALMWFNQSKTDSEGDWALNTSDAAVAAWKAGIAEWTSALSSNAAMPPAGNSLKVRNGSVELTLNKRSTVQIQQLDFLGRVLWQSGFLEMNPGVYSIKVPEHSGRSFYRLNMK
ncbi:MAG: dockerin [Fibrobacteraceae bacterium]|nr:dockerin [Fibrobacteraceae bacterium]